MRCVFAGTTNSLDFLPLDRTGNRRFLPIMCYKEYAEKHILEDEVYSREYIKQVWAEAMETFRSGAFFFLLSKTMGEFLKEYQKEYMPEDTKAGQIASYLENHTANFVCSMELHYRALGRIDTPQQWELREIGNIMNNTIVGWQRVNNPRHTDYGRQKGWERIPCKDGFVPVHEQMEIPFQ